MADPISETPGQAPIRCLSVWRFVDGKAGHEAQSLGLLDALGRRVSVSCETFDVRTLSSGLAAWIRGNFPLGRGLPRPDLLIGAGHQTHFHLLAARRTHGGKIVLLMRPSLPLGLFDFVVIPEHDGVFERRQVMGTKGVLNPIRPAAEANPARGLILIGGPSRHHAWDDSAILHQVCELVRREPGVDWVLTSSRRTPETTLEGLAALGLEHLRIVPLSATGPGWVAGQLQGCGRVVVSEDSASMVFEALTAGARVALLTVPARKQNSRVQRAIRQLLEEGRVCLAGAPPLNEGGALPALAEADRVAGWLLAALD